MIVCMLSTAPRKSVPNFRGHDFVVACFRRQLYYLALRGAPRAPRILLCKILTPRKFAPRILLSPAPEPVPEA